MAFLQVKAEEYPTYSDSIHECPRIKPKPALQKHHHQYPLHSRRLKEGVDPF